MGRRAARIAREVGIQTSRTYRDLAEALDQIDRLEAVVGEPAGDNSG